MRLFPTLFRRKRHLGQKRLESQKWNLSVRSFGTSIPWRYCIVLYCIVYLSRNNGTMNFFSINIWCKFLERCPCDLSGNCRDPEGEGCPRDFFLGDKRKVERRKRQGPPPLAQQEEGVRSKEEKCDTKFSCILHILLGWCKSSCGSDFFHNWNCNDLFDIF